MKVTSTSTGKTFEVVNQRIQFDQNNRAWFNADVVIAGEARRGASWFLKNDGTLSVLVTFLHNGNSAKMHGVATEIPANVSQWISDELERRVKAAAEEESMKRSQMYDY